MANENTPIQGLTACSIINGLLCGLPNGGNEKYHAKDAIWNGLEKKVLDMVFAHVDNRGYSHFSSWRIRVIAPTGQAVFTDTALMIRSQIEREYGRGVNMERTV